MSRFNLAILAIALAGLAFLTIGAGRSERERIANTCRTVGAFEADGSVFKCRERQPPRIPNEQPAR